MRGQTRSQIASGAAPDWIARHALGWLLAAQVALIAPHLRRLPVWVALAWLLCAIWRIGVFQGRWSLPGRWPKVLLIAVGLAGIRFSYGTWIGLEPTVALLIVGFSFKLVEAATRRDAYLLLFLGYFVALTEFLFEQGLGTVLYMLAPLLLLTCALIALQQSEPLRFDAQPLRKAAAMSAQALPLMLVLFLVFPRLAPLWQVPLPGVNGAATGLSDHIAPGDIAELSQSDELVFRAQFEGPAPARAQLYWRALVFDAFDGRAWRAGGDGERPLRESAPPQGPALDYRIYLEPTRQRWLLSLRRPLSVDPKTSLTADYLLLASAPVHEKFSYRVRSYPQAPLDAALGERERRRQLQLPAAGNPRARALAQRLRAEAGSDGDLVERALRLFRDQPYVYTLKPPPLGEHSVDEFLFDTRRGFCEHYAGAFTFLMRAAGMPARVVAGYQGGEINPRNGSVLLHQFDAHAWAEVWLRGRGWVRVDPTAAVAPQRIEAGLEGAVGSGEFLAQAPFSPQRYRHLGWINALRMRLDTVNYFWTRWVLNYRDQTQADVLQRALGSIDPLRLGALVLGGGGAALALVAIILFARRREPRLPPELRCYRRFCRELARRGYPLPPGMAPRAYAEWVSAQKPQWQLVREIASCFEALSYRPLTTEQRRSELQRLRRLVGCLRALK